MACVAACTAAAGDARNDDDAVPPGEDESDGASPFLRTTRRLLTYRPLLLGLLLRLVLSHALPLLLDDAVLVKGVRYTDVDYDVFTDAAEHVAAGRSPYERHTYRYTPFLAALLSLRRADGAVGALGSWAWGGRRHFGRTLFCAADAACGGIILALRRRRRRRRRREERIKVDLSPATTGARIAGGDDGTSCGAVDWLCGALTYLLSDDNLVDALWWLYNPLPINISTRGSAESLVVILPVLTALATATMVEESDGGDIADTRGGGGGGGISLRLRSVAAGLFHGVGMHFKLYPVIYTASYVAYFARLEAQAATRKESVANQDSKALGSDDAEEKRRSYGADSFQMPPWSESLPPLSTSDGKAVAYPFPWNRPVRLLRLIYLWVRRIIAPSSILFLATSVGTFAALTYAAVAIYGTEALQEGFLYHLSRVDHRHNYSMYWLWIYLARGRAAASSLPPGATTLGSGGSDGRGGMASLSRLLTVPQLVLLLHVSAGTAPYDLPLALFLQTFLFVAHNKVITAQYFTWYLCLLPLCSESVRWNTRRMRAALLMLGTSAIGWLGSAYCLEMRGMSVHRLVWAASVSFFFANVNLMGAILAEYQGPACAVTSGASTDTIDGASAVFDACVKQKKLQ